jgi:hypothetical protein
MPCSDSSSSICFEIDYDDRFLGFEYAKITCGREIDGGTGLSRYCVGWSLEEILDADLTDIHQALCPDTEESAFILAMEWDALRAAIAQFLGRSDDHFDADRCVISSIESNERGLSVTEVILPPKELPKILPCSLAQN